MAVSFGKPFRIKISNNKNEFLEIDMSGYLNNLATDLLKTTRDVTRGKYGSIIQHWADSSGGKKNFWAVNDMRHAICEIEAYVNIEDAGTSMSATVTYGVDVDKMGKIKSADEWMAQWRNKLRNKPGLDGARWQDLPSNEYRAQLMFEEGIIGLPKQSHFRRDPDDPNKPFWTNPNQAIYAPLEEVIKAQNTANSSAMQSVFAQVCTTLKNKGY